MNAERYHLYEKHMISCMGDSAHDAGHVRRVLHAAVMMARSTPEANMDVVIAAALLHDIGREEQFRTGENHALVGERRAYAFLMEHGESEAFARHVADCIRTHRFRSDDPPASAEAKILYDADKLDVCGAVGVARTLMYQGHTDQPIYSVAQDGTVLPGDEKAYSFYREYRHKLQNISSRFITPEGRRMARRRAENASPFNESLRAEVAAGESGSAWRLLTREASARQRRVFNISMMLVGDSEKVSRAALGEAVMRGLAEQPQNAAERAVADAYQLDDMGALGVAQRLMELGRERRPLSVLLEEERKTPDFYTAQARGIAAAREPAAREFIEAIRKELDECREDGEQILKEYLDARTENR